MANRNGAELASDPDIQADKGGIEPSKPLDSQGSTEQNAQTEKILAEHRRQKRTPGLKLFDVLLYPLLNNISVFALSVAATYLTARGGMKNKEGKAVYGKFGEFFQKRGEWLTNKFEGMGMTHGQADMSKMVFFSFADGSVVAPAIKVLEDRREHIAHWIDDKMGTKSDDLSVYDAEPKQTWLSVLGGRLATVSIVVPTAVALEKTRVHGKNPLTGKTEVMNLNQKLFNNPGIELGQHAKSKGWFKKFSAKHDMGEIARVSIFEAFYTSVCTAGLYITSRAFARKHDEKVKSHPANTNSAPITTANTDSVPTATATTSPYEASQAPESKAANTLPGATTILSVGPDEARTPPTTANETTRPATNISSITHNARLSESNEQAMAAV